MTTHFTKTLRAFNNVRSDIRGRRREQPPETTGPRTFSYGPKGVQKTTVDIPKESKASPDYKPPGTPKGKRLTLLR